MAKTPEGKVKDRIKKLLKAHGAYYYMPVPGGFGAASLDFHCHLRGQAFYIEAKAGAGRMTVRQGQTASAMRKAGAPAFLVNETTDEGLEVWLLKQLLRPEGALDCLNNSE